MLLSSALACALLATTSSIVPNRSLAEDGEQATEAVLYQGMFVCLVQNGRFRVWGLEDWEFDEGTASRFEHAGMTRLASNGDKLWATDDSTLYSWSPEENTWNRVSGYRGAGEKLEALVVVGGTPLLVFPSKVESPTTRRTFKVPKLKGHLKIDYLRVLTHFATDTMLWIGTGQGEWGGHLVGLDPETSEWAQNYDSSHCVTGITQEKHGELIVSWSMSHFRADTLIRVHKLDATPKKAYQELESQYYQCVVYNPFDETLYGIENTEVVTIKEGKPSKIAELEGQLFEREPLAIGVSPGVSALIPIAAQTLVIVPNYGFPWLLKDGTLTRLQGPTE